MSRVTSDLAATMISIPHVNAEKIAAVAYGCGFADATTFTRAFRKQFCTPRDWRSGILAESPHNGA